MWNKWTIGKLIAYIYILIELIWGLLCAEIYCIWPLLFSLPGGLMAAFLENLVLKQVFHNSSYYGYIGVAEKLIFVLIFMLGPILNVIIIYYLIILVRKIIAPTKTDNL